MSKTWVLRTGTKGTGAQMVPLEKAHTRPVPVELVKVPRKPAPLAPLTPAAQPRRRFRIIDVMTRQPVVDDVGAREAIGALRDVRSVVDVNVYVWHEERARWRRLTFPEQRQLFALARRAAVSPRGA